MTTVSPEVIEIICDGFEDWFQFNQQPAGGGINMLTEELKPRPNGIVDDSMKAPVCKEALRKELEEQTRNFLKNNGKIIELSPSDRRADTLLF